MNRLELEWARKEGILLKMVSYWTGYHTGNRVVHPLLAARISANSTKI